MPLPIFLSLFLALLFTIVPLPHLLTLMRPDWVLLVLIYWVVAFPRQFGIFSAFLIGISVDLLRHDLIGQNAIIFSVVIFFVLQIYPLLRVFPVWQQAIVISSLILLAKGIELWIRGISGFPPETLLFWAPVITSALIWPLLFPLLRTIRRRWLLHLQ